MSAPVRLAAYVAALAVVAALATVVGFAVGPIDGSESPGNVHADEGTQTMNRHDDEHGDGSQPVGSEVSGLAVSRDGYTLDFADTALPMAEERPIGFRILDENGDAVRDFDLEGGVRMHLIVVRRDLVGYQHLHPALSADGSFRVDLTLPDGGVWRAFADFERDGRRTVLATDLFAAGEFSPARLPEPHTAAEVDGYAVELTGSPRAGRESELSFRVARGGSPVALEPYLGARGHLVALRAGDLAYLHVHPLEDATPGEITFAATFPTAGRYRLFLQFNDGGGIHTAPFTVEVER